MKKELILVPDVHGRTFWRAAIPWVEAGAHCLFLGDYADPYPSEDISEEEAVSNLREIIDFARRYSDRVTLLLGNHDLSYLGDPWGLWSVYADRFSLRWADELSSIFNGYADRFALCAYREIGGKAFLFSHAGLHPMWIEESGMFEGCDRRDAAGLSERVGKLFGESLKEDDRTAFMDALSKVGQLRGGYYAAGSMVWADCREYEARDGEFIQIFGHTSQRSGTPYTAGSNICIDCQRCFYLDQEGRLRYEENDTLVK